MISRRRRSPPPVNRADVLRAVCQFDAFNLANDPYGEHDFGSVGLDGARFFWKIDYYNRGLDAGTDDPSDPAKTARVLTIMLASQY
jgi:hypothetical protein